MAGVSFGQPLTINYNSSSGQFCTPATISFTQQHPGNPKGYLWDFGNGQKSNLAQPEVVYTSPGNYTIKLIAVYDNYTLETTKPISIKSSTPVRISTNRSVFCTPSSVNFSLNANPAFTTFQWNFGDNSTSYSTTAVNATHQFTSFGNFTVNVMATNTNGCKTTDTKLIEIQPPSINGIQTNTSGCKPLADLLQSSVSVPAGSTVSSYQWNFGDGTTINTSLASINHNYNNTGDYAPTLTIQTNDGCSAQFSFDSVHVGNAPANLIARPYQQRFCGSLEAVFYAKADQADRYEWNFGFGSRVSTTDTIIQHKFSSLGVKNVTVTPYFNDCPGLSQTFQVEVIGTIAKFSYQNTCSDKRTFQFSNSSAGNANAYTWSFGNNNSISNLTSPSFTFPRSGNHPVTLISYDALTGCSDTNNAVIYTATPNLINAHESICVHTDTRFRVTNSYRNNQVNYDWRIMGQNSVMSPDSIISFRADSLGYFNNYVIVKNGNAYCPDTAYLNHVITVKGPHADFIADSSFCQSVPLQARNVSSAFISSDSIIDYRWYFGDNSPEVTGVQPSTHLYTKQGNYPIRLIAKDINGCKDTIFKQVMVRPMPFLWIIPHDSKFCQGAGDSMIAYTSDTLTWMTTNNLTNFCNNCDSNYISPLHSTKFYATSVNQYHCVTRDSAFVKVFEPFQASPTITDTAVCEQAVLQVEVYPSDKQIIWNPPVGLNSNVVYNPIVSTQNSRLYTAELTDSMGCYRSVVQINVTIKSNPAVELGGDRFLPFETPITLTPTYSNNVRTFEWTGSQALSCINCPNPVVSLTGTEQLTLKVTSDSGCVSTDRFTLAVECNNAYLLFPSAFTPDGDGKNDRFYPFSRGIRHILKFMVFDRSGKLLFQKNDFSPNEKAFGWDGKYMGTAQSPGTYVYMVEAICDMGQRTIKKGSFILIR